jgi:hypothetical protein
MLVDKIIIILGKIIKEEVINYNIKVRWFVPLDVTYAHCKVDSILYKIDIYDGWLGQYGQTSCFLKSLPQLM